MEDEGLRVTPPENHAAGIPAVVRSLKMLHDQVGVVRGARTLLRINQKHGFDCPGCAWPEGDHRKKAEFCENGVKAVAEEATERRITGQRHLRPDPVGRSVHAGRHRAARPDQP